MINGVGTCVECHFNPIHTQALASKFEMKLVTRQVGENTWRIWRVK